MTQAQIDTDTTDDPSRSPSGGVGGSATELAAAVVVAACGAGAAAALASAGWGRLSPEAVLVAGVVGGALAGGLGGWRLGRPTVDGADGLVALVVVVALARLGWVSTPWPVFLDASWYANTAAKIAETGGLRFPVPALELPPEVRPAVVATFRDERATGLPFPDDASQGFHAVAFAVPDVDEATAMPYHPPLYASWLAAWQRATGSFGWGVLAWTLAWLLAVAALARATFGPLAAPAAAALLGLGPALAYFGRQPYAEPAAAALAVMGIWCLVRLAGGSSRPALAAAAGLALGSAVLVKVDAVVPLGAALAWWVVARARTGGWREGLGLVAGLALPLAWFALLASTVSRLYVALNGGGVLALVQAQAPLAIGLVMVGGALVAAWWYLRRIGRAPPARLLRRAVGVVAAVAVAIGMARGWLAPEGAPPGMVAVLAWFVTPLGVWAAVVGLIWALDEAELRTGPVVAQALVAGGLVLAAPVVTQSLSSLYAGRRLVPMALDVTAVLVGAVLACWWRWRTDAAIAPASGEGRPDGSAPDWRRWVDVGVLAGIVLVGVGLVAAAEERVQALNEFAGGEGLARRVASHVGPEDLLLFPSTLQGADPGRLAAAIWVLTGHQTAVVGAPDRDPALVARAVDAWRAAGRAVYYVTDTQHEPPELPGYTLEYQDEESIVTYALAPYPSLPPTTRPVDLELKLFSVLPTTDSR